METAIVLGIVGSVTGVTALIVMFVFNYRIQRQYREEFKVWESNRQDFLGRHRATDRRMETIESDASIKMTCPDSDTYKRQSLKMAVALILKHFNLRCQITEATPSRTILVKGKRKGRK